MPFLCQTFCEGNYPIIVKKVDFLKYWNPIVDMNFKLFNNFDKLQKVVFGGFGIWNRSDHIAAQKIISN